MKYANAVVLLCVITGCAGITQKENSSINSALTLCGLGSNEKASDAMKIAFENAEKKSSGGFELAANNEIETQITILLKQYGSTSNESLKFAADQIKDTRECAIKQYNSMRKPSKSELLEMCRVDVQNKLSPKGFISYGTLQNWNTENNKLSGNNEVVKMVGFFNTGGSNSSLIKVTCDLRNNKFNESVITE